MQINALVDMLQLITGELEKIGENDPALEVTRDNFDVITDDIMDHLSKSERDVLQMHITDFRKSIG